jgi:HK97 family phage major capsid protein
VQNELLKRVVDLENQQLVYGTGGTTQLSGLTTTAGILTYPAVGTQENFTDIATAIAALRTGPALAEPDLPLLHPDTWTAIRTQKDDMGRFYVSPDPSVDQVEQVFGVDVRSRPGRGLVRPRGWADPPRLTRRVPVNAEAEGIS